VRSRRRVRSFIHSFLLLLLCVVRFFSAVTLHDDDKKKARANITHTYIYVLCTDWQIYQGQKMDLDG